MFEKWQDKICIIAEIGGNFSTYDEAVALIDAADRAGVDCVKLQTYRAETLSQKNLFFDMENIGKVSQYEFFEKYEICEELHRQIIDYMESRRIEWFSTPSHSTDLDMLLRLGMKAIKIGSDDATNLPFLKYCAKTGLPIVLSTGMCTLDEVKESVDIIRKEGNEKVILLHCISGYPTHPEHVNLNVLNTFKGIFPELPIGFSDHTLTPLACIAAAAMGVDVIERHFTINKNAEGPDHMISADPDEMKYIVDSIRLIETMKGSKEKKPYGPEIKNRKNNRKSIVALKNIKKGEVFSAANIDVKRPGYGIEPKHYEKILGQTAIKEVKSDELLQWSDFNL